MVRSWLRIEPARGQGITIRETASWETNCIRNRIWYRGDASEIEQLFKALNTDSVGCARFWAAAPALSSVRKAHSGLPAIMANVLAYLVKSDLNDIAGLPPDAAQRWEDIAADCSFAEVIGDAVAGVLAVGDGAFKISIDPTVSDYPLLEFWTGDRVDFMRKHGRITGNVFRAPVHTERGEYLLREIYEPGTIRYEVYEGDKRLDDEAVRDKLPELYARPVGYDYSFSLAIPFMVYKSPKYPGRGRSIYDSKTDAFDAHDEVISQWIDAVRNGRVQRYIPGDMVPRSPKDGSPMLSEVNAFGANFIAVESTGKETAADEIKTVQPEIRYEAFVESYSATLDMCLQGIMSPATLGINVGKMASADAQREKKDVTGYTRNAITDALEKVLPQVVSSMLMAYDLMHGQEAGSYEPAVSFGEYGAPDFDSRVETVSKAATASVMSIEAQVDELWGASKDEAWKATEVERIKRDRGIATEAEPSAGEELTRVDVEGNSGDISAGGAAIGFVPPAQPTEAQVGGDRRRV